MKKLIMGLFALLALSACKKSGSVDIVVDGDIRSMNYSEFQPFDEDFLRQYTEEETREALVASYNLFTVVPGTYKIEYYQDEHTGIAYNVKLTLKLHLNHSIRPTEQFFSVMSKTYFRGKDIHSMPMGEIMRQIKIMHLIVIPLDADGRTISELYEFEALVPPYCDYDQQATMEADAKQELFDFLTSPTGTEKEITLYAACGKDCPDVVKRFTNIYTYFVVDYLCGNPNIINEYYKPYFVYED